MLPQCTKFKVFPDYGFWSAFAVVESVPAKAGCKRIQILAFQRYGFFVFGYLERSCHFFQRFLTSPALQVSNPSQRCS